LIGDTPRPVHDSRPAPLVSPAVLLSFQLASQFFFLLCLQLFHPIHTANDVLAAYATILGLQLTYVLWWPGAAMRTGTMIATIDSLVNQPATTGTVTYAGTGGVPEKDVVILTIEGFEPTFVEAVRPTNIPG